MRRNPILTLTLGAAIATTATYAALSAQQAPAPAGARSAPALYNTVKQKLRDGKQVVGGTVLIGNPDSYCAMANSGWDFTWIEMQHSPMSWQDAAHMIAACKGAPAIPFVRVPDAPEGDLQKATDIGALGIMIPMVDTVEKAENAVKFGKFPPIGRRSQGNNQAGSIWGNNYRQTINDNLMIIAMIENPAGVAMAEKIAAVPGIDGLFVASTDLGSFSGLRQGDAKYESLVDQVVAVVQKRKLLVLGGPSAWKDTRKGYNFFQGPDEAAVIRSGTRASLDQPSGGNSGRGVAPIEGDAAK